MHNAINVWLASWHVSCKHISFIGNIEQGLVMADFVSLLTIGDVFVAYKPRQEYPIMVYDN